MSINWNNIRPLNNSLNDGFEELICQLASREKFENQKCFRRMGKPDGGKECYWEMADGSLVMWQAKYFTVSFSSTQWNQIDKSVKTAINNHPSLIKYYICSPLDMPDPKIKGKSSMLDKWVKKIEEWKSYAQNKGINTSFEYWGSSELVKKLALKKNEGLKYFWFNQEEFTDEWFESKNNESISSLGARYTKELNFDLPIAKIFDSLARDNNFKIQVDNYYNDFFEKYKIIEKDDEIKMILPELANKYGEFKKTYKSLSFIGNDFIPLDKLKQELNSILSSFQDLFYGQGKNPKSHSNARNRLLLSFIASTQKLYDFLGSTTCNLINHPFLLITGNAGMGKSHLLADIVNKRKGKGLQSLLLLGENFTNLDNPWTQILYNQLHKSKLDDFVFLDVLNAKAESQRSRIIIFIDALNEGNGKIIWPKRLKFFIQSIEKHPWLGLVVSIRSSFEKLIAPADEITGDLISRVEHKGFVENGYYAAKHFFEYYDIIQPGSPLLDPEFQNPLFLKLFCKSLFERKLHQIPPGYKGFTAIFDYYLDSINLKLARPEELYYDEKKPLVKNVIEILVSKMIEDDKDFVTYDEADEIANEVFKKVCNNSEPYLKRLISEGIFNNDIRKEPNGEGNIIDIDVISFAYQRFQDHLTVSILFDKYLNTKQPELSFQSGKLYELTKVDKLQWNQNLVESMSIQLPERVNKELFEVLPSIKDNDIIAKGFIQSLIWRKDPMFGDSSREYIKRVIMQKNYLFHLYLDVIISSAMKPCLYFNARWLHSFLMKYSLPKRDSFWTTWLQSKYGENTDPNAIKRLIDWAWNEEDTSYIDDDSILLGSIAISWFLTSSNRYLRDAATKALVCLLQHKIYLIPILLDEFKGVNDPYVAERLYAMAYGCALRTEKYEELVALAEYVYNEVFDKNEVYSHILLRDYAREIIEYSLYHNPNPKIQIAKIRPPYKSKALPKKFPSNEEIDKKYQPKGKTGNYGMRKWGITAILSSMTTEHGKGTGYYGDFGRYTFQNAFSHWKINYDKLSNYAVQRIFEIGYDSKLFSNFDSEQGSGRATGNKERIGKKYQWIVFYELLAQVSDQCLLYDESNWNTRKKTIPYDGPWYPYVRDIDPSIVIRDIQANKYKEPVDHWWFNTQYSPWDIPNKAWVTNFQDIPSPKNIIEVKDNIGNSWFWLDINPTWKEPLTIGDDNLNNKQRQLSLYVTSYLVKKKDLHTLQNILNKDLNSVSLPEVRSMYNIFSREYYWSPAFSFSDSPYYLGGDWIKINDQTGKLNTEVHRTTESFNWEEEFDCSKTLPIQYNRPTKIIKDGLKLKFSSKEGELVDNDDQMICFDPSVNYNSIPGLLIRKEQLQQWLEKEDLSIIWRVSGNKIFLAGGFGHQDYPGRLNLSGIFTLDNGAIEGKLNFEKEITS